MHTRIPLCVTASQAIKIQRHLRDAARVALRIDGAQLLVRPAARALTMPMPMRAKHLHEHPHACAHTWLMAAQPCMHTQAHTNARVRSSALARRRDLGRNHFISGPLPALTALSYLCARPHALSRCRCGHARLHAHTNACAHTCTKFHERTGTRKRAPSSKFGASQDIARKPHLRDAAGVTLCIDRAENLVRPSARRRPSDQSVCARVPLCTRSVCDGVAGTWAITASPGRCPRRSPH